MDNAHPFQFETAEPGEQGFSAERLGQILPVFGEQVASGRLPGAVALVARRGKLLLHGAVGQQAPGEARAMSTDSLFRIYSMTKPIVSVAAMMLVERGRLLLSDPVARHLPEFADLRVAAYVNGHPVLEKPRVAPTVQDLLRHTAGFTYEIMGDEPIQRMYAEAGLARRDITNRQHAQLLARLPLMYEPATTFAYSRCTDVLGAVVEAVSGQTLGNFLRENILGPLGMHDTGFSVPPSQQHRLTEAFAQCPDTGAPVTLINVREPAAMESGGGGLVSTAMDYARFLQCLLQGGEIDGYRLLSPSTLHNMTHDHLGAMEQQFTQRSGYMLPPGVGFGLGFAVRLTEGMDDQPGSAGMYYWTGVAGTSFFVDPAHEFFAVFLSQAPNQRNEFRPRFRSMVYAALME